MLHDSVAVDETVRAQIACDEGTAGRPGKFTDSHPDGSVATGVYQSHCEYKEYCAERAADGFNSGMGEIFRKVSEIGTWPPTCPGAGSSGATEVDDEPLRACE